MSNHKMTNEIIRVYVCLYDTDPIIWRRMELPASATLRSLHNAIQRAMGWQDYHLHHFAIDGERYGEPMDGEEDFLFEIIKETKIKLMSLINSESRTFDYAYDYGDDWTCGIVLENVSSAQDGVIYPRVIDGARNGPPEDVGGVWGYENLIAALSDPEHEDHEEMTEYFGDQIDPEHFDIDQINKELAKLNKRKRKTPAKH